MSDNKPESDKKLRALMLRLNNQYFGGEVPVDLVTIFWQPGNDGAAWTQRVSEPEDGHPGEFLVTIDPCLHCLKRYTKLVLIHELIHVKLWAAGWNGNHGKKFDEEIQRLVKLKNYRKLL